MNLISLRQALHLQQSLSSLSVGLTTGAIGVVFDLSYAVLIVSDSLASHLSAGIGLILLSAATPRMAIALTIGGHESEADRPRPRTDRSRTGQSGDRAVWRHLELPVPG